VGSTKTQHKLNTLNSDKYNSQKIPKPAKKLVKIRKQF
jgi:hypothetical protein